MIDASIVPAPRQLLSKEEKALVDEGAMPVNWKPAKRRQKDKDACWTTMHGKYYFGYKVLANADKRYKLVRKIKLSTASKHETTHFEDYSTLPTQIGTSWPTRAMSMVSVK